MIAVAVIVLVTIEVVATPLAFGKSRGVWGYSHFVKALLEAAMLIPLSLRVIGVI